MKKIVSLIDFTGVCELSLEHTSLLARESIAQVTLLHIVSADQAPKEKEIKEEVRRFAKLLEDDGIPFSVEIDYGPFFETIGESVKRLKADLLVVGTHGLKGIKQNFVGSNILKLIRAIDIPALVIQSNTVTPIEGYTRILVPLLSRTENSELIEPVGDFANTFQSDVIFLTYYTAQHESEAKKNTQEVSDKIAALGITTRIELEKASEYSSSYSRSIVEFSDIEDAELITLIINRDFEHYFSTDDQENILLNRLGKPVLCI